MLDIKNITVQDINTNVKQNATFVRMKDRKRTRLNSSHT